MSGAGVFAAPAPRVFTISPSRPFLDVLARGLLSSIPPDPLCLADTLIYVPTRRAAKALGEAFVAAAPDGGATLLPRIRALGEVDEDEIALDRIGDPDLPPAASASERRLVLARLVAVAERVFSGQESWPAALASADELAALLDSLYSEEISFQRLAELVPAEHADHWGRSLKFLRIVTEAWPEYLAERGLMDPTERRARLIDLDTRRLATKARDYPVIVAGSTGSAPSVSRLMDAVARLPLGAVVLPGLDLALARDERAWAVLEDAHPQAGLKKLLAQLDLSARDVLPWPSGAEESARGRLLSLALRPAEATDDWRRLVCEAVAADGALARSVSGLSLVEAADEEAEASAIALALRETLETPEFKAILVTPDRNLARRVSARLRRWEIDVDDSAGMPFANTLCGVFLRLLAAWLDRPSDPVSLLALLRSPLAGLGLSAPARDDAIDAIDRSLRGKSLGPTNEALKRALGERPEDSARAAPALAALDAARALWPRGSDAPFTAFLDAHLSAAESLAASDAETGAARLWRGEDGEAGALLLSGLRGMEPAILPESAHDYSGVFSALIAGAAVRRRTASHPRLSILGPLEARLQSADLVILGGLNEGVWPGDAGADAFLSRAMRLALGLPSLERRIGLSAHDFAQAAAAPRTLLTRSRRVGGAPARPSRWIVRLKAILQGAQALENVDVSARFASWTRALDSPKERVRIPAPRPTPPVEARPRALAVTRVETWLRDPYAIYARSVLGLKKLEKVGAQFDARTLGSLLHRVFEEHARSHEPAASIFFRLAPEFCFGDVERAFWGAAVEASLTWFESYHAERLKLGAPALLEHAGAMDIPAPAGAFTLSAKADRIDILNNGEAYLIDYKSRTPSLKQMRLFSVQLPLMAAMVAEGAFPEIGRRKIAGFAYIKALQRGGPSDDRIVLAGEAEEIARDAMSGLARWISSFDDPHTPYLSQPRAEYVDDHGDYDHLARRRERSAMGGEE